MRFHSRSIPPDDERHRNSMNWLFATTEESLAGECILRREILIERDNYSM